MMSGWTRERGNEGSGGVVIPEERTRHHFALCVIFIKRLRLFSFYHSFE